MRYNDDCGCSQPLLKDASGFSVEFDIGTAGHAFVDETNSEASISENLKRAFIPLE